MYPDEVVLFVSTEEKTLEGIVKKSYTAQKTIRADVQPYGGEKAMKDYGITDSTVKHRMFCPIHLTDEHTRIEWKGRQYAVKHIATFRNRQEILLSEVS